MTSSNAVSRRRFVGGLAAAGYLTLRGDTERSRCDREVAQLRPVRDLQRTEGRGHSSEINGAGRHAPRMPRERRPQGFQPQRVDEDGLAVHGEE